MAAEGVNIIQQYIYRGGPLEEIPREATRVFLENIAAVPEGAFDTHPNIVEVICHEDVETIEEYAFAECLSLRRVILRGVKVGVEGWAFCDCEALEYVECDKLEIINEGAFGGCKSLKNKLSFSQDP